MRQSAVTTWLLDEIETFLTNTSLVSPSTPSNHVDEAQAHDEQTYPFVGVQKIATNPQSAGIGNGELQVDSVNYGNNGNVQSIDYVRDVELRVEVIPTTDDDSALRDDLAEDLASRFALLARTDGYPSDIDSITVGEATPSGRPDEFVRGDGVPLEIDYERHLTDDTVTAAETVNIDVDVGDYDDDISESDDVDAFDESL